MENILISAHARVRISQRGLKPAVLDALISYGCRKRRHGADVFFMNKEARERAQAELGSKAFAKIESGLNAYLVVADDGTLVTCAKRLKRIL